MERWIKCFLNVLEGLLKHPDTLAETAALAVLGCAACFVVLGKTGKAMGFKRYGRGLSLLSSLLAWILILLGLTAVEVFFPSGGALYRVGAAAGISLILVVPLISLIHKGNYVTALITWLISVGAAVGVVLLVSAGIDSVVSGSKGAGKTRIHKREMEQLLDK